MDTRTIIKRAQRQGLDVRRSRGSHFMFYADGRRVATMASTPSDCRSHKNALAHLKRAGFDLRTR